MLHNIEGDSCSTLILPFVARSETKVRCLKVVFLVVVKTELTTTDMVLRMKGTNTYHLQSKRKFCCPKIE